MPSSVWNRVCVPTGRTVVPTSPNPPRRASGKGVESLGLLYNMKANGDVFLKRVQTLARERLGVADFIFEVKPSSSSGMPAEVRERLLRCSAVVTAVGD